MTIDPQTGEFHENEPGTNMGMSEPQDVFHYNEVNQETSVATIQSGPPPSDAPVQMDPAEEAAMKYTKLLPYITKLSSAMPSKGGLVRVITAMAEFPIGGRQPRLLNDAERQLFMIMQELNGYKSTVIQSFIKKQSDMEQMKKTATEMPVAESETNGGNEKI